MKLIEASQGFGPIAKFIITFLLANMEICFIFMKMERLIIYANKIISDFSESFLKSCTLFCGITCYIACPFGYLFVGIPFGTLSTYKNIRFLHRTAHSWASHRYKHFWAAIMECFSWLTVPTWKLLKGLCCAASKKRSKTIWFIARYTVGTGVGRPNYLQDWPLDDSQVTRKILAAITRLLGMCVGLFMCFSGCTACLADLRCSVNNLIKF